MALNSEIIEIKEYHENGALSYLCTFQIIPKNKTHLFSNVIFNKEKDLHLIRIGTAAKFFNNGVRAWQINYNLDGSTVKNDIPNRRKDNTIIQF